VSHSPKQLKTSIRQNNTSSLKSFETQLWLNGKTRYRISPADSKGKKHKYREGDIGFGHYAFELRSRKDVDALQAFVKKIGAKIVDPAGEYYEDYYGVYFTDPDGLRLEGMHYH
jgi:catechol 2,3-dioxygenase-like lactoylglutathione lyase family enzyme